MPYQPNDLLSRHFQESGPDLISQVEEQLNRVSTNSPNIPIYRDMILTVLRMAQEDHNRWNAKITLQALRELEQTFRVLEQFKGRRKVTVFGSARTPVEHPLYALARELGATELQIHGDSELVVKQMLGQYKVKHPDMKPLHAEAKAALEGLDSWSISHVRREQNAEADALVNQALDSQA